jgi:hypothetical protein
MLEPIRATPDREYELGHQLFGAIASIALWLWQPSRRECRIKSEVIQLRFMMDMPLQAVISLSVKRRLNPIISPALK